MDKEKEMIKKRKENANQSSSLLVVLVP